MNALDVIAILQRVPFATEVIVKGRKNTVLSVSIPETAAPAGWRAVGEAQCQAIPGQRRVVWTGEGI